ncbi:MAG: FAD-dependent tricarballylate dehydrogenase TcuA [Burkholderiales bacterium]
MSSYNVIVIGAGNAALCAALSAQENGARVLVLERSPPVARGGNSAHSGGAFRVVFNNLKELRDLMPDLADDEVSNCDFGTYTKADYLEDMGRISEYQCDPDLAEVLADASFDTAMWMRHIGARWLPPYGRQSSKVDGKNVFWGGVSIEASGGGLGLMNALFSAAEKRGIDIKYEARALKMLTVGGVVCGVRVVQGGSEVDYHADAVVLAAGGFHANAEWRTRYLGKDWDLVKVRGNRFNTGDGIRMALDIGAIPWGNWSGCHSVFFDRNAPAFGDLDLLNQNKNGFSRGIVVNALGKRFMDEGADIRSYVYSQMGRRILEQPGRFGYQVFDQKIVPTLPDEYRTPKATRIEANTIEELAAKMEGVDSAAFVHTVREFNAAVSTEVPYNPAKKDGRCTSGLEINKSNWANRLDAPPFVAWGVTAGITFTYGGLRIDTEARVLSEDGPPIPNLYATGELVGGLYYIGYPGGAGLMAGSVFGRIAGRNAATR